MIRIQHTSLHLISHQKEDVGFGCHAGSVIDWAKYFYQWIVFMMMAD